MQTVSFTELFLRGRPAIVATFWLVCLSLSACLFAQDATLTNIDGKQTPYKVQTIKAGVLSDGQTRFDINEISVIRTGLAATDSPPNMLVHFAGGGIWQAESFVLDGESFQIRGALGEFKVPTELVKGIVLDPSADLGRFQRAMNDRSPERDFVIAEASDGQRRVAGLLEAVDEDKVYINYQGKRRPISRSKVIGIVTADLKPAAVEGVQARVKMVDGSTIHGVIKGMQSGTLDMVTVGNVNFPVDYQQVLEIVIRSDRLVYLSDLDPTDAVQNSLATLSFGWQRDRSVQGNPLRMYSYTNKEVLEFNKGIGTHSASRLEFQNELNFNRFVATVGIDFETDGKGDCEVSVWGDGIKLWSAEVSGGTDPQPVDLDISGMKQVSLVVRNGKHLDLGDHVDWANARFLKVDP